MNDKSKDKIEKSDCLALVFSVGKNNYLIDSAKVEEIIPMVALRDIPHTPEFVAGLLSYRGGVVPVIDLASILTENKASDHLSTRIILIKYPSESDEEHTLGLIAEKVLDVKRIKVESMLETGISVADAPCLGPVETDTGEMNQLIEVEKLLPDSLREQLFKKEDG